MRSVAIAVVAALSLAVLIASQTEPVLPEECKKVGETVSVLEAQAVVLYHTAQAIELDYGKIDELSSRLDNISAMADEALQLAQTLYATHQAKLTITPTLTPVPTSTSTPTPTPTFTDTLCQPCSYDRQCAPDQFCKDCPGIGKRCVRKASPNGDCANVCPHYGSIVGLATYYNHGETTRSGDKFDVSAMTCAVPDEWYETMRGNVLRVCSDKACIKVLVNDSGYLLQAGQRCLREQNGILWYYPCESDGQYIVVDLTPKAWELLGKPSVVTITVEGDDEHKM